ncbi:MAG: ATP-binding protein [Blautia sp.]|uniref:AAA family ATPase n=1 Tax=Blautia sp. TaxID=1955243 RepID=UPI0025C73F37|nr:AAA family ATPase [Blautia sp.]MCI6302997.1 ATP-binding protein [Blautia sp.]MCI7448769.1 ATP-binding protein [Blautia sp.]
MGIYLNSSSPYSLYKSEYTRPYFVDKSKLLRELMPLAEQGNAHVCITRPRRFGKTVMANMIGAFFSKGADSSDIFDTLQIARDKDYRKYLNQYNVIYIDFSKMPGNCKSYEEYISRIEERLKRDLLKAYPEIEIYPEDSLWDILESIFDEYNGQKFIFIFDEWDCIFHKNFVTQGDRQSYISFLSNLLKDHAYVSMSYMTGILPISKYSSGSELNMFIEYTMASEEKFSDDFGFTESEVDILYKRYLEMCQSEKKIPYVTREGLETWYDGYYAKNGEKMYNPRSVAASLSNNNLDSYWTSSGPYDEIFYYVKHNVAEVRKDLAVMISGEGVPAKIKEYAATSMNLTTREEILSAMVVYGFLSYYQGKVYIPNKELMDKFDEMLQKESSLGYVYNLAKESERMLQATLNKDTCIMEEILAYAHNTETPILSYNNEVELSSIVNLVYLSARDRYRVEREDKAGLGFVDFIFYPENPADTGIILELKVDHTAEEAIQQIIDKKYSLRFQGKLGEKAKYTGEILAVGIGYNKKTKEHQCKVVTLKQ